MKRITFLLIFTVFLIFSCQKKEIKPDHFSADIVLEWNQIMMKTAIKEDNLLTLKGLRSITMMHIAMHDALNSIIPRYNPYLYHNQSPKMDPIAMASYAAYNIAVHQYPDNKEVFDELLNKYVASIEYSKNKILAKQLAKASSDAILNKRTDDKWNGKAEYTWHPMAPGVYSEFNEHSGSPEGFVFGSGWAVAVPFMLPSPDHFRVPPPPKINSTAYTKAFYEVKEVGSDNSISRTKDQSHLAMWWKEFVESSHNRLLRDLIKREQLNLWDATRSFALMNMSIYDAYINVFNNKFHYNHWRPYTAIRWAAHDKNDETEADINWNNLHNHTYPFPSYPSAHGTASSAAMTVLANTFNKGKDYSFTMTQKEVDSAGFFSGKMKMNPSTRSFDSFSEAAFEASMSRVYLGIHFRYDSEQGNKLGNRVGNFAINNFLKKKLIKK